MYTNTIDCIIINDNIDEFDLYIPRSLNIVELSDRVLNRFPNQ